ncbi:hypothetical protein BVI434_1100010 [Burkholderia vietnamiensis]|nr:hypothetical protein BVI434_1100010 [Burkholderia vietnamiensis]
MPSSGSCHAHPRSHRLRPDHRQHGLGALLHDARPRPHETHGLVARHPRRAVGVAVPVHPVRELDGLDPFDRPAHRALMDSVRQPMPRQPVLRRPVLRRPVPRLPVPHQPL